MMSFQITPEYLRVLPERLRQEKLRSWLITIQEIMVDHTTKNHDLYMVVISALDIKTGQGYEPSLQEMDEMSLVIKSKGFEVDVGTRCILGQDIDTPVIEIRWPIDSDPYSCYHEAKVQ